MFGASLLSAVALAHTPECDYENGPFVLDGLREVEVVLAGNFEDEALNGIDKQKVIDGVVGELTGMGIRVLGSTVGKTDRKKAMGGKLKPFFYIELSGKTRGGQYLITHMMELRNPFAKSWSGYLIGWTKDDMIFTSSGRGGTLLRTVLTAALQDLKGCWEMVNLPDYREEYLKRARETQRVNAATTGELPLEAATSVYKSDFVDGTSAIDDWFIFPANAPNAPARWRESGFDFPIRSDTAKAWPTIQFQKLKPRNLVVDFSYEILNSAVPARLFLNARRSYPRAVGCELGYASPIGTSPATLRFATFTKEKRGWSGGNAANADPPFLGPSLLRAVVWEDRLQCYRDGKLTDEQKFSVPVDAGALTLSGENVRVLQVDIFSLPDFRGPH